MKCDWCGKFMSYKDKDAMTYTYHGGCIDTEPPQPIEICGKCWNDLSVYKKHYYRHSEYIWIHATKLFKVLT